MKKLIYYKDIQWYVAFCLGGIFWVLFALITGSFQLLPVEEASKVLLFVVLLYPLLEELVFRGWIQGELYKRKKYSSSLMGISAANLFTSVFFAASHLFYQTWFWSLMVFFPSIVFGYFRDRYNQILPSFFLHAFYNFGFILFFHR